MNFVHFQSGESTMRLVRVRPEAVTHLLAPERADGTIIYFQAGDHVFVAESPDVVEDRLTRADDVALRGLGRPTLTPCEPRRDDRLLVPMRLRVITGWAGPGVAERTVEHLELTQSHKPQVESSTYLAALTEAEAHARRHAHIAWVELERPPEEEAVIGYTPNSREIRQKGNRFLVQPPDDNWRYEHDTVVDVLVHAGWATKMTKGAKGDDECLP